MALIMEIYVVLRIVAHVELTIALIYQVERKTVVTKGFQMLQFVESMTKKLHAELIIVVNIPNKNFITLVINNMLKI